MNQETFNAMMKALVFATSVDVCADDPALGGGLDAIKELKKLYPEQFKVLDLDGISIYGSIDNTEDEEINKELVEIFGDTLKIDN